MTGIDSKKAYDMVSHSWIKEYLELFGVAENVKTLCNEFRARRN